MRLINAVGGRQASRRRKKWFNDMNYEIQDYPKNENRNYILGDYQQPEIIDTSK